MQFISIASVTEQFSNEQFVTHADAKASYCLPILPALRRVCSDPAFAAHVDCLTDSETGEQPCFIYDFLDRVARNNLAQLGAKPDIMVALRSHVDSALRPSWTDSCMHFSDDFLREKDGVATR